MPPICPPPVSASKKSTGQFSAAHAALGGRTLKTGQSRCLVGYKKHTLRLWLHHYAVGVQMVPLVSWVAPAHVFEGGGPGSSPCFFQQPLGWGSAPVGGGTWCRWSVGSRPPMFPRAGGWFPACIIASSNGTGVRRWWWRTWGIWGQRPNNIAVSGGGWLS